VVRSNGQLARGEPGAVRFPAEHGAILKAIQANLLTSVCFVRSSP